MIPSIHLTTIEIGLFLVDFTLFLSCIMWLKSMWSFTQTKVLTLYMSLCLFAKSLTFVLRFFGTHVAGLLILTAIETGTLMLLLSWSILFMGLKHETYWMVGTGVLGLLTYGTGQSLSYSGVSWANYLITIGAIIALVATAITIWTSIQKAMENSPKIVRARIQLVSYGGAVILLLQAIILAVITWSDFLLAVLGLIQSIGWLILASGIIMPQLFARGD
ncbi:MAG: hypothetical protein KAR35_05945 [Candidatus Heimdallarchaeota archaeon]|nr:hypothetical protein [Candidatus Heimdallarchaeota archaeon]MCK5048901.1 hypothetical protein [Candidatus Heimdallarchaeota archaeon]